MGALVYRTASLLSLLATILALIPVLLPVVCLVALISSLAILGLCAGEALEEGPIWRRAWNGFFRRPLRRSARAIGIALVLYGAVWLHSELFYVGPLKRDQEPFRKDAAEQLKENAAPNGPEGNHPVPDAGPPSGAGKM